jgi:hypothetical protein
MTTDTTTARPMTRDEQKRQNRRLGWTLASVALVFGLGFIAKIVFFGR